MPIKSTPIVGIVGGLGPYAGLDLFRKILDQTIAGTDQEHLSVAMLSYPGNVGDRSAFVLGKSQTNPGHAIADIVSALGKLGSRVVGIPCNSAHSPVIFEVIKRKILEASPKVMLLNMIDECIKFLNGNYPHIKRVGVLSTAGTYKSGVYKTALEERGYEAVQPDDQQQIAVQKMIYSIKANSNPPLDSDRQAALFLAGSLFDLGSEAIIMGCTEIPLVISEKTIPGSIIIDPAMILARALIREVSPDRLKPLNLDHEAVHSEF